MNDLIRDNTCVSCTITSISPDGVAEISFSEFKKAKFDTSVIVLYEHMGIHYYPMTLEYRLIDNNVLYLIEELNVRSMEEVFKVLASSMEKEEKWTNEFVLALVHLKNIPKFCHRLENLSIGDINKIEIYE
jgi:hypothetical protein